MNIIENVNRLEDYLINESEISLIDIQKISTYLTNIREEAINYTRCCEELPQDPIELARYLHDSYEMIAKKQNWNTQESCKVEFSDLPIGNKNTMILLAGKLILDFGGN